MRKVCDRFGVWMVSGEVCVKAAAAARGGFQSSMGASDLTALAKWLDGDYLPIGTAFFSHNDYDNIINSRGTIGTVLIYGGHRVPALPRRSAGDQTPRGPPLAKASDDELWLLQVVRSLLQPHAHIGGRGLVTACHLVDDGAAERA